MPGFFRGKTVSEDSGEVVLGDTVSGILNRYLDAGTINPVDSNENIFRALRVFVNRFAPVFHQIHENLTPKEKASLTEEKGILKIQNTKTDLLSNKEIKQIFNGNTSFLYSKFEDLTS